jgi:hypothetical protein
MKVAPSMDPSAVLASGDGPTTPFDPPHARQGMRTHESKASAAYRSIPEG